MNDPPRMALAFPKPGRALWAVMGVMAVLGILDAFLVTWVSGGDTLFLWLGFRLHDVFRHPWTIVTSGLLTDPTQWMHLVFSLVGLYFLAPSLEARWGGERLLRFLALAVVFGNLTTLAVDVIAPVTSQSRFHPALAFGPTAMITAIAVAWSREFAQSTVNLFFFLPMKGRILFWVTIGFCVLDLIFPSSLPEGVVAPFGGVIAGLVFGGTPSLTRKAWLHLRLAVLRRRSTTVPLDEILSPKPKKRSRSGGPPLRVVSGGLEDVLKQRTPPKDKRHLN